MIQACELVRLRSLGGKGRPVIKAGPFGSAITKDKYSDTGYKVYGQEQVIAQDATIGNYYIPEEVFQKLKACQVKAGDLLISLVGTVGKCLVIPDDHEAGIINPRLLRLSFDNKKVCPHFIKYVLESDESKKTFLRYSQGGTMGVLNAEIVGSIKVFLPSKNEQNNIVAVIKIWDRAIDQTEKLIEAKRKFKKGLMQKLLTGQKRLGEELQPWRKVHLREVFQRVQRSIPDRETPEVLSITATVGFVSQKDKFSRVIAGKNLERYVLLRKGEYAYNKGNSKSFPQGCIYRLKEYDEGAVPNVYYSFRANSKDVYPPFYSHYFSNGVFGHQLSRVINTGVRNDGLLNLDADDFFSVQIHLPPIDEQKKIAAIFDAANEEIRLLGEELTALRNQKKGLMQKLLTGNIRVKV